MNRWQKILLEPKRSVRIDRGWKKGNGTGNRETSGEILGQIESTAKLPLTPMSVYAGDGVTYPESQRKSVAGTGIE